MHVRERARTRARADLDREQARPLVRSCAAASTVLHVQYHMSACSVRLRSVVRTRWKGIQFEQRVTRTGTYIPRRASGQACNLELFARALAPSAISSSIQMDEPVFATIQTRTVADEPWRMKDRNAEQYAEQESHTSMNDALAKVTSSINVTTPEWSMPVCLEIPSAPSHATVFMTVPGPGQGPLRIAIPSDSLAEFATQRTLSPSLTKALCLSLLSLSLSL